MYFSTYEDIQKQVIFDINENDKWSFSGIRLIRKIYSDAISVGKKMTVTENLRLRKEELKEFKPWYEVHPEWVKMKKGDVHTKIDLDLLDAYGWGLSEYNERTLLWESYGINKNS